MYRPKNKNKFYYPIGIFFLFILITIIFLPLINNIFHVINGCTNTYDFGIYQQAIYEIAKGNSYNPYVSIRNIFIFFEHFDPIIFTAVPIVWLFKYKPISLMIFEWLWYFMIILFIVLKYKNKKSFYEILFSILILCSSRSIQSGMAYPIHPVTWAIFPLFFFVYYIYKENNIGIIISTVSLILFKETFAFGLFLFSFFYLLRKQYKLFFFFFIFSSFFILFEMKFRRLWFGNDFSYGNKFLSKFLANPKLFFKTFDYKSFIKVFIPYLIPIFLIIKYEYKKYKNFCKMKIIGPILFLLPLVSIHFIINRFFYHHISKFGIVLSASCILGGAYGLLIKRKFLLFITILIFVLTSSSVIKKMAKFIINKKNINCIVSNDKRTSIKTINYFINKIDLKNSYIWSTGSIAVNVIKPNMNIYQYANHKPRKYYSHLLLSLNGTSDTYPLSQNQVSRIKKRCNIYASNIIINNKYFYFAKGRFPYKCVNPSSSFVFEKLF